MCVCVCVTNALQNHEENTAPCGAPDVDWKKVQKGATPPGWQSNGFSSRSQDHKDQCKNGWTGFADGGAQGELFAKMKASGTATVKYRDCNAGGFIGLYVNGVQIDKTVNKAQQKTFRYSFEATLTL